MAQPFRKVLVANRGEIARRVIRGCRARGLATVAVHSDPDAAAPFAREADEAVPLAGSAAAETYLMIDVLLDAAARTGADAVHPGYGFLAENAEFAERVLGAGLVWIGPPPAAIAAMGSKVRARELMEAAGVPVVPGRALADGDDLAAAGEGVGYPLLVKASAGGGGKGMRPVAEPGELEDAVAGARREAEAAFGDPTVFLERHLQRPRHIEIQVLADADTTVSLGERECSVQRRHQKILEEAPSTAVDDALRERLGEAAVATAEAVGYVGAGTVEFLLDEGGGRDDFFFLEMNTRLQVEHPVTEMVLGIDLVAEQLRIAAGGAMSERAREPRIDGHAIEVRLYAEDAAAGFLPQTGTVERITIAGAEPFAVPDGPGPAALRLDSGVEDGTTVGPEYDPMLAKLIAWAPDRGTAAARLAAALAGAELDGLVTNRGFLVRLLRSEPFGAGATDTGLLDREPGLAEPLVDPAAVPGYLAAAALAAMAGRRADATVLGFAPPGFRNNFSEPQRVSFATAGGEEVEVTYALQREGTEITVGSEALDGVVVRAVTPGEVDLEVAGVRRRYRVRRSGGAHHVNGPDGQLDLRELPRYPGAGDALAEGALVAPMPGRVIRLAVTEGAAVEEGAVVAVLEAMKMEHELLAPSAGTVAELHVAEGDQVDAGAPLAVIDPA
ncbi:MAG TPA: biotin carboxylase N-terminal domain-containing protein [Solirubrobacterales bacterium]|nr:biotin carboxylase N-terminal domain-containing protein [Solirubrobacterales bacterium]